VTVTLKRRDNGNSLVLDASPEQRHTPSVSVTSHPVADQAEVADHAERKPRRIKVEGIVTATPFVGPDETPPDNPLEEAVRWLDEAAVVPLRLETTQDGTYEPVMLTRYPYTVDQVRDRQFSLELQQVRLAEAETVRIPERKEPTLTPGEDKGAQETDNVTPRQSFAGPDGQQVAPREKAQNASFQPASYEQSSY